MRARATVSPGRKSSVRITVAIGSPAWVRVRVRVRVRVQDSPPALTVGS